MPQHNDSNWKRQARWALALAILALCVTPGRLSADKQRDVKSILDAVDDMYRGDSSYGRMRMELVTKRYTRALEMEAWSKGKNKSLIRILEPKRERGTTTLRDGREIWNYLPKVNRVVRLPSSMMSRAWMGSHLTNDDLVRESRMANDFECEISFDGARDGADIIEISCTPKPNAAVVWGRVVVEVEDETFLPRTTGYFDEDIELVRTITFDEVRSFGSRRLPSRMTVKPADKPSESTTVTYEELDFDKKVPDSLFSIRSLRR
jgi:outer membrane lipoprotein-sorting protein